MRANDAKLSQHGCPRAAHLLIVENATLVFIHSTEDGREHAPGGQARAHGCHDALDDGRTLLGRSRHGSARGPRSSATNSLQRLAASKSVVLDLGPRHWRGPRGASEARLRGSRLRARGIWSPALHGRLPRPAHGHRSVVPPSMQVVQALDMRSVARTDNSAALLTFVEPLVRRLELHGCSTRLVGICVA